MVAALVAEGACRARLAACDVVCVAVPDDAAVLEVVAGLERWCSCTRRSCRRPRGSWANVLDAPVSGGAERALAGELTIMVGGSADGVRPRASACSTRWDPTCGTSDRRVRARR